MSPLSQSGKGNPVQKRKSLGARSTNLLLSFLLMNPGEEMSGKVSYDTFHIILVSFGLKIQAETDCTLLCSTSNMPTKTDQFIRNSQEQIANL